MTSDSAGAGRKPRIATTDQAETIRPFGIEMKVMIGGKHTGCATEATVGPGAMVYVPKGSVHAFSNITGETGRLLEWTIPGSNGDYFRAVHEMEPNSGFDPDTFAGINRRFVAEFVG